MSFENRETCWSQQVIYLFFYSNTNRANIASILCYGVEKPKWVKHITPQLLFNRWKKHLSSYQLPKINQLKWGLFDT